MSPPTHIRKETRTKLHTATAEHVDTNQLASPATVPESGHSHVSANVANEKISPPVQKLRGGNPAQLLHKFVFISNILNLTLTLGFG